MCYAHAHHSPRGCPIGLFLALSAVVSRSVTDVEDALRTYAAEHDLRLERTAPDAATDEDACLTLGEANGHTTIFYPDGFCDWDEASRFLSGKLGAAVFSFHIHDGDFWMFQLFDRGELITAFNPIPDYWGDIEDEEREQWRGDAEAIATRLPGVAAETVARYLKPWDLDELGGDGSEKAFPDDEYAYGEEWQLTDFLRRLGLPAFDEGGRPRGSTYRFG